MVDALMIRTQVQEGEEGFNPAMFVENGEEVERGFEKVFFFFFVCFFRLSSCSVFYLLSFAEVKRSGRGGMMLGD